jgi:hypothetical protein
LIRREMLLSARYLAGKWGASQFREERETELLRNSSVPLPELRTESFQPDITIANFKHGLDYAPPRWPTDDSTLDRVKRRRSADAETVDVLVRFHDPEQIGRLSRCVFSLYCQTHSRVQPIILLQNFDFGEIELVNSLANDFDWTDRLRPIIHNVNTGEPGDFRSQLINVGMSISSARYLAILDYDDLVYPYAYDYLIERLIADDAAISIGTVLRVEVAPMRKYDYILRKAPFATAVSRLEMFCQNCCPPSGFLLDKSRIGSDELNFDEALTSNEDYEFLLRILAKYPATFAAVGVALAEYQIRTDGSNSVPAFSNFDRGKVSDWQRCQKAVDNLKARLKVTVTPDEIYAFKQKAVAEVLAQVEKRAMEEARLNFERSTSWRITAPLRFLGDLLRRRA